MPTSMPSARPLKDARTNSESASISVERHSPRLAGPYASEYPELLPMSPSAPTTRNALPVFPPLTESLSTSCTPFTPTPKNDPSSHQPFSKFIREFSICRTVLGEIRGIDDRLFIVRAGYNN